MNAAEHETDLRDSIVPVNRQLVWDYPVEEGPAQSRSFRRWYLGGVLTRGRAADLRAIGFDIIAAWLPDLHLPPALRRFWRWYFELPEEGG